MPWIVGIDEAGYGPNLGPLVMSAVACRVPDRLVGVNLWQLLKKSVRRATSSDSRRLLIDDSKLVYSTAKGIHDLEQSVLATALVACGGTERTLACFLRDIAADALEDLDLEPWYAGRRKAPVCADPLKCAHAAQRFAGACTEHNMEWQLVRSAIICPTRFNAWLEHWGSKGAILGQALARLLGHIRQISEPWEPIHVYIDKHGGRNTYAALLQDAIGDGMVVALEEGNERSRYDVLGIGRDFRLTIEPRADGEHFCVALASMVSKYFRELLMMDFNEFWSTTVPGLKPTAGYPGDSSRFFEEIRPAMTKLRIPVAAMWRKR